MTRAAATTAVQAVLDGITDALCSGHRVEIRGFGTLRPRHYPEYLGRNPATGARVVVGRKVLPAFRPSRALLERVEAAGTRED